MGDRALHIAIDGRELVGQPTGVGRYLLALLQRWAADAALPHRYTVVLPAPAPPHLAALGPRFTWVVDPASPAGTWWEQTRLPRALARAAPNVFFAAGYTAPLRLPCPFVVAIYDVSFFAHPDWFPPLEGWRRRTLTRLAARRARAIVTISEFSASEIVRWIQIPRTKIHLAPPGAPVVQRGDAGAVREPLVLYVGSMFTRRRIPDLLQAFALARERVPGARLVLVGDNRTSPRIDPRAMAASLGIDRDVDWREYVNDEDLAALYSRARVFAFLSDYEGFGMTPLEAMAYGVPAVVLDSPIAREVYGGAAKLVPPEPPRIANALTELLSDARAHAALRSAGTARLARYSWPASAGTVMHALERAAATR